MRKNYVLYLLTMLLGCINNVQIRAQENNFQNNGILQIEKNTVVGSYSNFNNSDEGNVKNDGESYYFGNFTNQGIYDYNRTKKSGKVLFITTKEKDKKIQGDNAIVLNHVEFDNQGSQQNFDLQANIDIYGDAVFTGGIIQVDSTLNDVTHLSKGMLSFMQRSQALNVGDHSFVDGMVEKVGSEAFLFPIGNKEKYRPALISAPRSVKDIIVSRYHYNDTRFFVTREANSNVITYLNTMEYWRVEKSKATVSDIILTLSWDESTTPMELLKNPEEELHIVYWDAETNTWVDQGGVVDVENKTISTPTSVKKYGYFTLATIKGAPIDTDVHIYNLVTANGDGKNDYFLIENITNHPKNKVQLFNRWGVKVYQTSNYDSNGNVFNGYGNTGQSSNDLLPSGTYFYVLTYDIEDSTYSTTVKKTGYLHLETN